MDLDKGYDLQPYAGAVILRLENHGRFDNYYNTYTDIQQVWVEQGDPPSSLLGVFSELTRQAVPQNEGVDGPRSRE